MNNETSTRGADSLSWCHTNVEHRVQLEGKDYLIGGAEYHVELILSTISLFFIDGQLNIKRRMIRRNQLEVYCFHLCE